MSATSNSFDQRVKNITICANAIIQYKLDAGTITEKDTNVLRNTLIRIRTNPKLKDVIIDFNESSLAINGNYINKRVNNITIDVNVIN